MYLVLFYTLIDGEFLFQSLFRISYLVLFYFLLRRSFVGLGTPGQGPSVNRLTETVLVQLYEEHPYPVPGPRGKVSCNEQVSKSYGCILNLLENSPARDILQLANINKSLLSSW